MKKFLLSLLILSIIVFDIYLLSAGTYALLAGSGNLFQGIVFVGMGLILAFCLGITMFVAKVTMESTKINVELLQMMMKMQMQNRGPAAGNPLSMLSSLLGGFPSTMGGPDTASNIQILGTDENGNIKPMAEHTFKPGEDKDEILAKMLNIAFGKEKPAKKAIEEMGLEELKTELEKALSEEKYEKASLLRNKINELEQKK